MWQGAKGADYEAALPHDIKVLSALQHVMRMNSLPNPKYALFQAA